MKTVGKILILVVGKALLYGALGAIAIAGILPTVDDWIAGSEQ